jgi:hypothetical protein
MTLTHVRNSRRPLIAPGEPALQRYCAVAGQSLLTVAARALGARKVGHFDYLALADLTEAILFHDRVLVLAGSDSASESPRAAK